MKKLLTIPEVAEILGISESTAKIWASRRIFPVVKVGRLVRISPYALQEWIEKNTEENVEDVSNSGRRNHQKLNSRSFEDFVNTLKKSGEI
jgi:excisionase family DNA binding protein